MTQRLLFLDFETYYDDEYSLRKMTPAEYILDERFETILCAVREGDGPTRIIDGPDFPAFLATVDPSVTTTVTHNALFDNAILAWRYGFIPKVMLDTMGMARAVIGHELKSVSLESVAAHLGLGAKGKTLLKVKGLRRHQIQAAGLWPEFCSYATQDADLCAGIFYKLLPKFPGPERRIMNLVLRAACEPMFHVDKKRLCDHLDAVRASKAALLTASGATVDQLMSASQFAERLTSLGVPIEYKTSPTGRQIPAFAKTDEFMNDLSEHADPAVQALAAARLGHKSTLEETRSVTLLTIAMLPWDVYRHGNKANMPIPLGYGKAHTHRLAGEWGMNMQNLPRGGNLRKSLIAPPGHKVVVADLGQIEARVNAWVNGQMDLLQAFRDKKDPYAMLASEIFGREIIRKRDVLEGFIGKTGVLGLGYACGAEKFFNMVIKDSRKFKINLGEMWTFDLAQKAVDTYRRTNNKIRGGWYRLDSIIASVWGTGAGGAQMFGPCVMDYGSILGPCGLPMLYDKPTLNADTGEWFYHYGRFTYKIYGAKMLENIVQYLSRIIIMNTALRLADRGYRFVLQAHDELAFIVPDVDVDRAKAIVYEEFTRSPSWAKDLPLAAEVGAAQAYGEAK